MKKILHVSHSLSIGGGPEYIKKIVNKLPQYNHYIIGTNGYNAQYFIEKLSRSNVKILYSNSILINMMKVRNYIRKIKPDIIHIHGRGAAVYTLILLDSKYYDKTIYTFHGFNLELMNVIKKLVYLLFEMHSYKKVKLYIHVSESEKNYYIKNNRININKRKHIVIPNYVEKSISFEKLENIELDKSYINFVSIARLTPEKGIDILLNSVSSLKYQVRFFIIGDGSQRAYLEDIIKEKGLDNKVYLLGRRNNARKYLHNFDAYIITSRFEGMPYSLLEAMDAGVPVVAVPTRGIIDVVDEDCAYIAKNNRPSELRKLLKNIVMIILIKNIK